MFVLLERSSGIVGCDISDPVAPTDFFYFDNRNFTAADVADAGDLGPESAVFIPAADSPTGDDLLAVANEVSGTTTLYKIEHDIPAENETSAANNIGLTLASVLTFTSVVFLSIFS